MAESSTISEADVALAREALLEITPAATVGEPLGSLEQDGVLTLYFATTQLGYPGWRWTVSIARVDGEEPSVLETELTPGDGALLSPDWIPWADRLADYRAAQEGIGEVEELDDESDDDDDDDDDDDLGSDVLHAGDVDGVDIDDLVDDLDDDTDDDDDDADDDEVDEFSDDSTPAAFELGIAETDEAEGDADSAAPEPPDAVGADEGLNEEEQHDEGDHPER